MTRLIRQVQESPVIFRFDAYIGLEQPANSGADANQLTWTDGSDNSAVPQLVSNSLLTLTATTEKNCFFIDTSNFLITITETSCDTQMSFICQSGTFLLILHEIILKS